MVVNRDVDRLAQATKGRAAWLEAQPASVGALPGHAEAPRRSGAPAGAPEPPDEGQSAERTSAGRTAERREALERAQRKLAVFEGLHAQRARRQALAGDALDDGPERVPIPPYAPIVTPRERQILQAIADGSTNEFIAYQLGISAETVKTHVANLLSKLRAANRAHAVSIGFRMGILR